MMRGQTLRAVVCDDDALLRSVLCQIMRDTGYRVVAEVDSAETALETLAGTGADVVIVDLALRVGKGEALIEEIRATHPGIRTVVFSAYAEREAELLAAGADAVFAKPDFSPLEKWLRAERESTTEPAIEMDRRRLTHPLTELPKRAACSPNGLEPWKSFTPAVAGLWPGDALLSLDVLEAPVIADEWNDPAFLADFRHSIARLAAEVVRDHDRISMVPSGGVVVALVAGTHDAPRKVFERIERAWDHAGGVGTVMGSFDHVTRDEDPMDTLHRVLDRMRDGETTILHPLRLA